jgi:hypothetical protein
MLIFGIITLSVTQTSISELFNSGRGELAIIDNKIVLIDSLTASVAEDRVSLRATTESSIGSIARSLVADDNIWAEFLKLQISEYTKGRFKNR